MQASIFGFGFGCLCCHYHHHPRSFSSSPPPHHRLKQRLLLVFFLNTADNASPYSHKRLQRRRSCFTNRPRPVLDPRPSLLPGVRGASQATELFPAAAACPEVVVREARIQDCWDVADTHCSSFFPNYSFPFDLLLRVNRLVALFSSFSVPIENNNMRKCLVAVIGNLVEDNYLFGTLDLNFFGVEEKFSFNKESVAGILTIDTLAEFLPRKGPLGKRRTGIAYISNVAVKRTERRKGIAKKLMAKAEEQARRWGCRSLALHCDANNPAAVALYKSQGFRCIMVPRGANWPEPRTAPGSRFHFMMKLLTRTAA